MSSRAAGKPREEEEEEEKEKEEEDFYDCQETLERPDRREAMEEEPARQVEGGSEEFHVKSDRLTERGDGTDGEGKGQEEVQGNRVRSQGARLQEEVQRDKLQKKVLASSLQVDRLQEEVLGDRLQGEVLSDRLQQEVLGDRLQQEVLGDRLQQEVLSDRLQQEVLSDRLQDDSDSELKEENSLEVEFDDDYLKEVEKELTEEEKESRRQQSLTLKEKGNGHFKAGDWSEAERRYKEALVLCPVCFSRERAVLFSNRAAARLHLGLKDQAISDCTRAIELNPDYVRALLRRAELYEQTEKLDEALEDYKKVLDCDPNQTIARQACMRLPHQIQERNEKLKEEMMSKLKDLGNLVLRPFGLSTNNFQVNQDADTGSYSINFVQNPNNNNR
ncbi:tetratricopeptide repeat protein 1 [Chelmon rostratus]|uniref:tetratricopeptide repeat protein 1 n=1 Tax=Chelmon rostratus TaxID=109905 RepID=UPI001BE91D66|nr:tetratricopeptide repeat protein 1 [Chelmon rostratus]